jgi:Prenyltransferase and squalene oxidase repeat
LGTIKKLKPKLKLKGNISTQTSTASNFPHLKTYVRLIATALMLFFIIGALFSCYLYPPSGSAAPIPAPRTTQVTSYLLSLADPQGSGGFLEDALDITEPTLRGCYYVVTTLQQLGYFSNATDDPLGFRRGDTIDFIKSLQTLSGGFANTVDGEANTVYTGMAVEVLHILSPELLERIEPQISIKVGIFLNYRGTLTWSDLLGDGLAEETYWTVVGAKYTGNLALIGLHPLDLTCIKPNNATTSEPHNLTLTLNQNYYPDQVLDKSLVDLYYNVRTLAQLITNPEHQEFLLQHLLGG